MLITSLNTIKKIICIDNYLILLQFYWVDVKSQSFFIHMVNTVWLMLPADRSFLLMLGTLVRFEVIKAGVLSVEEKAKIASRLKCGSLRFSSDKVESST